MYINIIKNIYKKSRIAGWCMKEGRKEALNLKTPSDPKPRIFEAEENTHNLRRIVLSSALLTNQKNLCWFFFPEKEKAFDEIRLVNFFFFFCVGVVMNQIRRWQRILFLSLLSISVLAPLVFVSNRLKTITPVGQLLLPFIPCMDDRVELP